MPKFIRKHPVEVDAVQWDGDFNKLETLLGVGFPQEFSLRRDGDELLFLTHLGRALVPIGDWIVKPTDGKVQIYSPSVFPETYIPAVVHLGFADSADARDSGG